MKHYDGERRGPGRRGEGRGRPAEGRGEAPGERVARAFSGEERRERTPRGAQGERPPFTRPNEPREPARRPDTADDGAHVFGVQPVLEALRAGARPVERLTVAEGAHESRLREILEIARYARLRHLLVLRARAENS